VKQSHFFQITLLVFFYAIFFRISKLFEPYDMWHDASFTVLFSQEPIKYILTGNDVHPPLYYLIMRLFLLISDNEVYIRLTSVLFFSIFFWLLFNFLNKRFTQLTTIFTLMILSFSTTMIFYSLEPRNYMLGMIFVLLQVDSFLKDIMNGKKILSGKFILYSTLMIYTHYFTVFILLSEFLYIIYMKKKELILKFIHNLGYILLLSFYLIIYFLVSFYKVESMWFDKIDFVSLISTFSYMIHLPDLLNLSVIFLFIGTLPFLLHFLIRRERNKFYLIILLTPIIFVFLISQFHPLYHHRFFLFYSFAFYIIIAKTITYYFLNLKGYYQNVLFVIFIIAVVLINSFTLTLYDDSMDRELYEAQLELKEEIFFKNKEVIILHTSPFSQTPLKYYMRDYNVKNLLKTNLTKRQLFSAGGSVIKDYEIVNQVEGKHFVVTESSKYDSGRIIYTKGGLIVYEKIE